VRSRQLDGTRGPRGPGEPGRDPRLGDPVNLHVRRPRGQVRVAGRLRQRHDGRHARVRAREHRGPLRLRPAQEPLLYLETGLPSPAARPLLRDLGRRGAVEQQADELGVELRLDGAHRHVPAIGGLVDVVVRRPRVEEVHPALVSPEVAGQHRVRHRLQRRGPVDDRRVYDLAAPGAAGLPQRRHHAQDEEHRPAPEVPEVVDRDLRRAARPADRVQRPGDGDVPDVVAG
jgi:hypothetical protein